MSNIRTIKRLKQDAKQLRKEQGIKLSQALDLIARSHNYADWATLIQSTINDNVVIPKGSKPSSEVNSLNNRNRNLLAEYGINFSVLVITRTGIDKSIMDAVGSLRSFFQETKFHDYDKQEQGPEYKVLKPCSLITPEGVLTKKVSFYRPMTKNGDPRIWVYGLKPYVKPNDELAFFIIDDLLYIFNLNLIDLSEYSTLLSEISQSLDEIAIELRDRLLAIASQPLKAIMKGDTAVGMTIEHALNLPANSSKKPDYKGIELKSGRVTKTKTRKSLFAQVPNWKISSLKSSKEIVDKYGYERDGDLRLYCTVNALSFNRQGLKLVVDSENDIVSEIHETDGVIVVWEGRMLRERLLSKHHETFWISAKVSIVNGQEYYSLKAFTHTKNPLTHQLLPLIEQGFITLDHLIKRENMTGSTREKGPFFKLEPNSLDKLFPEPVVYSLIEA